MKKVFFIAITVMLCLSLSGCGNKAKTSKSSDEYAGMTYDSVLSELQKAGFEDIQAVRIDDLTSTSALQDGVVSEVSIDGKTSFESKTNYSKDAKVVITYHIIKRLLSPISSSAVQDYDYLEIGNKFSIAGFTNVNTREVYDIDPETTNVEFRNEVIIASTSTFEKETEIPFDADINIICHRPFEKHVMKMHVDFLGNLFFSKYDVKLSLDGVTQYTLNHGEDDDFEFNLKEGTHTFCFASVDSPSVKGEFNLDVSSDIEASYEISCSRDKVNVQEMYVDRKVELSDTEAKATSSASDYFYKNYAEVVTSLKEAGFTNIKIEVLYDIVFGITNEGATQSVSIDGVSDFKRGDIFTKNAEIIVTYHSDEDNDPVKIHPPYDSNTSDGVNYQKVVQAFKDAGFANISIETSFTSLEENDTYSVSKISINKSETFDTSDAFESDAKVIIYYYVTYDGNPSSDIELTTYYAQKAFEEYGEKLFPYGFKCHWFLNLINEEKNSDGSIYFKVGVTIKDAYGRKVDTVAEGTVTGTDNSVSVKDFYVSNY